MPYCPLTHAITCIYACDQDISVVLNQLNNDLINAMDWFKYDFVVANPAKFQIIFIGTKDSSLGLNIHGNYVTGTVRKIIRCCY